MNVLCGRVEQFIVVAHTHNHPTTEEWRDVLEVVCSEAEPVVGVLVSTRGGSPSAFQRRQLRDTLLRHQSEAPRTAVLTHSKIAQMAIVAMNLTMGNQIKAFPLNAVYEALLYTKSPPRLWPQLMKLQAALQARLWPCYSPGIR